MWFGSIFTNPVTYYNVIDTMHSSYICISYTLKNYCIFRGHTVSSEWWNCDLSSSFNLYLPAIAIVSNMVQFNGYWGCWHCLQKGKWLLVTKISVLLCKAVGSGAAGEARHQFLDPILIFPLELCTCKHFITG